MEQGTINFGQLLLPWAERQKGVPELLRRAAQEIDALGPITILDFSVQGLQQWQGKEYLQESIYFTYRIDDLVADAKFELSAEDIQTRTIMQTGQQLAVIEAPATDGPYAYPALLAKLAETCQEHEASQLAGVYFDHRLDEDNRQRPFFVASFLV